MAEMIRRRGAAVGNTSSPRELAALYMPSDPTTTPAGRAPGAPLSPLLAQQLGAGIPAAAIPERMVRREPGGAPVSVNPFVGAGLPEGMTYAGPAIDRATGAPQMPAAMPERSYAGSKFGGQLSPAQRAYIEQTMSRRVPNMPVAAPGPGAAIPAGVFGGQQQAAPPVVVPGQQLPAMQMPTRMR